MMNITSDQFSIFVTGIITIGEKKNKKLLLDIFQTSLLGSLDSSLNYIIDMDINCKIWQFKTSLFPEPSQDVLILFF